MRNHQLPNAESFLFSWYGFVVEILLNNHSKTMYFFKYTALLRLIYLISDTTFKITSYFCLFFFIKAGKCCN